MLSKELIKSITQKYPSIEDELDLSEEVVLASDFREKDRNDEYWGISILLCDTKSIQSFDHHRKEIKKEHNREGQEINYKKIKAYENHSSLVNKFLNAADTIDGILFNFIINPSFDTVHNNSRSEWQNNQNLSTFKYNQFQKIELFSHLSGLIVASINSKIETLKWVTDNDNLINNPERKETAIKYFFRTVSKYLGSNDIRYEFIDPDLDSEDRILADLTNIPDLIVGPLVDIKNSYLREDIEISEDGVLFPLSSKTKSISYSEWFFSNDKNLKKVNIEITFDPNSNMILFEDICAMNHNT